MNKRLTLALIPFLLLFSCIDHDGVKITKQYAIDLQDRYVDEMLRHVSVTKGGFLGGAAADSGFHGGTEIIDFLEKKAKERYPDGSVYYQIVYRRDSYRDIKEYPGYTYYHDFWRGSLFRKNEDTNE